MQNLYPMLQRIIKGRGLHFLVAPYTACAQVRADIYSCDLQF